MAASTVVSDRSVDGRIRGGAALSARAAARTAPRGAGLAPVVALPVRSRAGTAVAVGLEPLGADAAGVGAVETVRPPRLRLVAEPVRTVGRPRTARRLVAALAAAGVLAVAAMVITGTVADRAELPEVAGHVVLQPGETLWDVAVRSAPAGVDPRRQLDTIRRLNAFGPGTLDAWTVVLIPAP